MSKHTLGWREWIALPELGIERIKAKVDTGARTSALHAFELQSFRKSGDLWVRFALHPVQKRNDIVIQCEVPVLDEREVTDSGGHREMRYVIKTPIIVADHCWPVEMTLTNRDTMGFRMLLGRTAMKGLFVVDPNRSYCMGKPALQSYHELESH